MPYQPPGLETLKALETAPNMYLVLSPDLFILTASNLYLEATQNQRHQIVGKHIFEAFPDNPALPDADGVQNINASLQEVLRNKKPHQMPVQRYDVPDIDNPGQFIQRYWHPSHTPVLNEDGTIHYIIQLANNVTDSVLADNRLAQQLIAHQKLQLSEQHFKHLADIVPAKISNALPSGEVIFFNKNWLDYAGMNFEDLRDFGYYQMMHPDEIPTFQVQLGEAAAKGMALESEMRFKDINGHYRWHLNIASPVLNENGEIIMWVGSTTDIQRIKEEEQRKTDFISMVSHELKTPLTSLKGYVQLLQQRAKKEKDIFRMTTLEKANRQVGRMQRMINGFLSITALESGKLQLNKEQFNLVEVVKESLEDATLNYPAVTFRLQDGIPLTIEADRDKIEQVLINLLSNGVKYAPQGKYIDVACWQQDGIAIISVQDQGIGITPDDLTHLFERFYRIQTEQTKNISGFGIGLYLCYEIITRHNGRIWAESQEGQGSTFYFSLPMAASKA